MTYRTASVLTHYGTEDTAQALGELLALAGRLGVVLKFSPEETAKLQLTPSETVETDASIEDVDICIVLGGDGTILRALRVYAGTGVPVFAVDLGEVGFLATVSPDETARGFAAAFKGEFEVLDLPAVALSTQVEDNKAINDVAFHREPGSRVAKLAYAVDGEEVGRVRCDGLVVATPAGSTGYNLANGGPVLAWGVEGFVVSFIAPHSLTARTLVVAPEDTLTVLNASREPVTLAVDGRSVGQLLPNDSIDLRFVQGQGRLAQMPGSTFYGRLREKFGRLSA